MLPHLITAINREQFKPVGFLTYELTTLVYVSVNRKDVERFKSCLKEIFVSTRYALRQLYCEDGVSVPYVIGLTYYDDISNEIKANNHFILPTEFIDYLMTDFKIVKYSNDNAGAWFSEYSITGLVRECESE